MNTGISNIHTHTHTHTHICKYTGRCTRVLADPVRSSPISVNMNIDINIWILIFIMYTSDLTRMFLYFIHTCVFHFIRIHVYPTYTHTHTHTHICQHTWSCARVLADPVLGSSVSVNMNIDIDISILIFIIYTYILT